MNFRILIYSNPLIVDKISKRFIYYRDSGFIFTKSLIKTLPDDYRFYWLVPDKLTKEDREWFTSANKNVELIDYPYSTGIHQNRYEFYGDVLRKSFPYTKDIDFIFCNQPEVSANLRVWADNQRRDLPIIYSFFHWIDCEESRRFSPSQGGYFWREYDGALASDAIYLHKGYGESLWKKEIEYRGVPGDKINIRPYTPSYTYFGNEPISLPENKKIILFNHRLNQTTNWKDVIDVCSKLYLKRQDFVLWITDENRNLKIKDLESLPFLVIKQLPDENYGYLIKNSHFSVCNHKGYSTWNMAVLDAIMNGCYTILPKDPVYLEMFKGTSSWFHNYFDLYETFDVLLDKPIENLKFSNELVREHIFKNMRLPISIYYDMKNDINSRIKSKPAKYDEVVNFINENGGAFKRDWVNKFWTFHTNSNFQKIRWNLMKDGFSDDTSFSETFYYNSKER